jgi:hypothetical protein
LNQIVTKYQLIKQTFENDLKQQRDLLNKLEEYSIIINEVKDICSLLLEESRKKIQINVSNIVTLALREIKNTNDIEFIINFEFKRNQPEAYLYIKKKGQKKSIQNSYGGGVSDIVSTVLKLVFYHLLHIKGFVFVDEPGKWIDPHTSIRYVQFLKQLCYEFKLQMLFNTHKAEIIDVADKLIEVYNVDGESVVKVD